MSLDVHELILQGRLRGFLRLRHSNRFARRLAYRTLNELRLYRASRL